MDENRQYPKVECKDKKFQNKFVFLQGQKNK